MKVFFTSDLHFGHANVIRFDGRPFETVEEMNEELIRRWNAKVDKGDLVYVLGDMIWRMQDCASVIRRLNGQIILIKGNHDRFVKNAGVKNMLAAVKDYDDICVTLEDGRKKRCILSHYFIPMYIGHRYNAVHLHGHSHNTEEAREEERITQAGTKPLAPPQRAVFLCPKQIGGVSHLRTENFMPFLFREVRTAPQCSS